MTGLHTTRLGVSWNRRAEVAECTHWALKCPHVGVKVYDVGAEVYARERGCTRSRAECVVSCGG
jgi:hypothetical protein